MEVDVLVPWRPGCPHRQAALDWLRARRPGLILGRHDHGPWRKALAVADALSASTADVIVIHDADVWCDGLDQAVAAVADGAPWAIPHQLVHRLDEPSTTEVLAGGPLAGTLTEKPYTGWAGGGIVVVARSTYDQVPLDPRFAGWGQEDASWAIALTGLVGEPWRGDADLWHLWHPPQARDGRIYGNPDGKALNRRYRAARHHPARLAALIEEARSWSSAETTTASGRS